jgi:hypothetical protein
VPLFLSFSLADRRPTPLFPDCYVTRKRPPTPPPPCGRTRRPGRVVALRRVPNGGRFSCYEVDGESGTRRGRLQALAPVASTCTAKDQVLPSHPPAP